MKVVGGTYKESVVMPDWLEWAGSGMRAAAALTVRPEGAPELFTAVDAASFEDVDMVRSALGVTWAENPEGLRTESIGFRYMTPISAPAVNGPNSRLERDIEVKDDTVLVFGLIEDPGGRVKVEARTLVLDPQRPRDPVPMSLQGLEGQRIFVVANSGEVRGLGQRLDIRAAAANVLEQFPAVSGVVTKRGAAGCIVTDRGDGTAIRHEAVGAHPTTNVWPIGSGDVFSAGIAHAIDTGADLVEAARIGSAAAAHWCSTKAVAVPSAILRGETGQLPRPLTPTDLRVYLAAPFFTLAERWLVETVKDELTSLGARVWSPFHEVGPGGDEVAQQDLEGLLACDVVLALLDHSDPGTIFEVGWAVRHDLPVVGYATVADREGMKMMAGTKVELHRDLSTACYRAAWVGMGLRLRPGWMP